MRDLAEENDKLAAENARLADRCDSVHFTDRHVRTPALAHAFAHAWFCDRRGKVLCCLS